LFGLTLLVGVLTVANVSELGAQESEPEYKQVEAYLARLRLADLQILHLEETILTAEIDQKTKLDLAKQLADIYANTLMSVGDDAERYAEIEQRIRKLLETTPEANTTGLQVMLLQADFTRAETLIDAWILDRTNETTLADAKKVLDRIAPQLTKYQRELNKEQNDRISTAERSEDEEEQKRLFDEAKQKAPVIGRATFFAGWANYYHGLTKTGAESTLAFKDSLEAFRALLDLHPDEKYEDLDASYLGLESLWRSRALVGLAQAEMAAGNIARGQACFALLNHAAAPLAIRDLAPYYQLRGLLNAELTSEATDYVREHIKTYAGNPTQGKISLCVALLKASFETKTPTAASAALGDLGMQGLARLGQVALLRKYLSENNIELPEGEGFYLTWIRGEQEFEQAVKSGEKADFESALATLSTAIEKPEARADVSSAGDCRYKIGLCHFQLERYEKAADAFQKALPALKAAGGDTALNAAWSAFVAYYKLSSSDPRFTASAITMLEHIKEDFPASDKARKADGLIARLRQASASAAESIASWEKIEPDAAEYPTALYELAKLRLRVWREANNANAKTAAASELNNAMNKFLSLPDDQRDDRRSVEVLMLGVEISYADQPASAEALLLRAKPWVDGLATNTAAAQKFYYYSLRIAQANNASEVADRHAAWLFENARGSPYERSAVILLAKKIDAQVRNDIASGGTPDFDRAESVYSRLAKIVGNSTAEIQKSKNARIANSRLAYFQTETGQHSKAAQTLEKLVAAFPKEKDYLQRAARASFAAEQFETSLKHWQVVLRGVETNSTDWFEAKYHQMECLRRTDIETARTVHRQFRILYPTINNAEWAGKFADLKANL